MKPKTIRSKKIHRIHIVTNNDVPFNGTTLSQGVYFKHKTTIDWSIESRSNTNTDITVNESKAKTVDMIMDPVWNKIRETAIEAFTKTLDTQIERTLKRIRRECTDIQQSVVEYCSDEIENSNVIEI